MDAGINFRATSGYVTDPAGTTYTLGDAYPTTRGGVTFGWESLSNMNTRDRNSGVDARLAGVNWEVAGAGTTEFRIDLDAANAKDVRLALGDAVFSSADYGSAYAWTIRDSTTSVATPGGSAAAGSFRDATSVELTAANWPASNAVVNHTFSTTILRVKPGNNSSPIAHIRVTDAGGGATGQPTVKRFGGVGFASHGGYQYGTGRMRW